MGKVAENEIELDKMAVLCSTESIITTNKGYELLYYIPILITYLYSILRQQIKIIYEHSYKA
jgi:hypothetical protein